MEGNKEEAFKELDGTKGAFEMTRKKLKCNYSKIRDAFK